MAACSTVCLSRPLLNIIGAMCTKLRRSACCRGSLSLVRLVPATKTMLKLHALRKPNSTGAIVDLSISPMVFMVLGVLRFLLLTHRIRIWSLIILLLLLLLLLFYYYSSVCTWQAPNGVPNGDLPISMWGTHLRSGRCEQHTTRTTITLAFWQIYDNAILKRFGTR
jgi:Ca2+/Na+ antiporter